MRFDLSQNIGEFVSFVGEFTTNLTNNFSKFQSEFLRHENSSPISNSNLDKDSQDNDSQDNDSQDNDIQNESNGSALTFSSFDQVFCRTINDDIKIIEAISEDNVNKLKSLLPTDVYKCRETLFKKKLTFEAPIFHAIAIGSLKVIDFIINKQPLVLEQLNDNNLNPFEFAIQTHIKNLNSEDPDEAKIAKSGKVLNLIYKTQFKAQDDLSDEQLKLLADYYFEKFYAKSHIKLSYNITDEDYPMNLEPSIMLYKNLLQGINNGQENLDQSQSNPFLSSALKTLDSIDNFDKPIEVGDEKLYIFEANLQGHSSYFIFHVNNINKLTHISYCDGNYKSKINNPKNLCVRKFQLKTPIDFNQEFVDEFLKENTRNVNTIDFYKKFREQGLKLPISSASESEFLSNSEDFILTKNQDKGNCTFKSKTILWRYLFQFKNPNMAEGRMAEGRLDIESQDTESQHANPIYKEFKAQITISAIERLKESKEKLQKGGFGQEFIDYFIPQVDQILKEVSENADIKIRKNKSHEHSQLHKKIKLSAESPFESKPTVEPSPANIDVSANTRPQSQTSKPINCVCLSPFIRLF